LLLYVAEIYFPFLFQLARSETLESGSHRCHRASHYVTGLSPRRSFPSAAESIGKAAHCRLLEALEPAAYNERFGYQQEMPSNDIGVCFVAAVLLTKDWRYKKMTITAFVCLLSVAQIYRTE
jgi:hypothetical protein